MFYKQDCPTGYALDVAMEEMQVYRGIIIGHTCTVESGIVVFFAMQRSYDAYIQAFEKRLGPPSIREISRRPLEDVKAFLQWAAPSIVTEEILQAKNMRTFFNYVDYASLDAKIAKPQNIAVIEVISLWRDQLVRDLEMEDGV